MYIFVCFVLFCRDNVFLRGTCPKGSLSSLWVFFFSHLRIFSSVKEGAAVAMAVTYPFWTAGYWSRRAPSSQGKIAQGPKDREEGFTCRDKMKNPGNVVSFFMTLQDWPVYSRTSFLSYLLGIKIVEVVVRDWLHAVRLPVFFSTSDTGFKVWCFLQRTTNSCCNTALLLDIHLLTEYQ